MTLNFKGEMIPENEIGSELRASRKTSFLCSELAAVFIGCKSFS